MRKNPARKLPARKLLASFIAGALFIPNMGFTLGLGEIEVNSALNQKLNADIELLSATPEDSETLIVKLASRKEFSRAGLDRPYLLNDLRFKSTIIDGTPHINVSSGSPIREPFLNFLVEIDWPNGHMIREYTVLLDPPVFMTQAASNAAATNNQAATANGGFRPSSSGAVVPVVTPVPTSGAAASSRPQAAVQPVKQQGAATDQAVYPATNPAFVPAPVMQQTVVNQPAGSYRIKSGDTAWSLADAMRPDQSISVEQMMIAMLRSNPESFINENVNGLKRGYILRVPDYDQVTAVSQQEARALVREQAGLWRQFQQTQAGGQPVSAMPSGTSGGAGVEGGSAAGDDSAYLEIVSAGSGSSTISGKDPTDMTPEELRAELALARERVETEKVEKEALQQRIDELELNAGTREGMMSIEDDALSDVQALGQSELDESGPGESDVAVTGGDMIDPQAEQELRDTLAELSGDVESTEDGSIEGEAADSEVMDAEAESADAELVETEEAVFVDESEDSAAEVEIVEQEVVSEPQSDMAAESQLVDRTPPADPLSQLLNDPMLLAAAGGGLLLIVAVIGLFIRRRKAAAEEEPVVNAFDDIESIASDVADEAAGDASAEDETQSLAGQSEGSDDAELDKQADDFDSDATTMLDATEDTIVTETADDTAAEEGPRDDVIAEADVYLAYGIYQQAEELLTQAIADHPERDDYRLKLAETHYASKNASAFIGVANEIKSNADGDDNPIWKKVLVMGQDLCPDEIMFQGSMVSGLDVDSMAPKAPEMDFDLGLDSSENNEEAALNLDDDELELPEMDVAEERAEETADVTADDQGDAAAPVDELEFDLSDTGAMQAVPGVEDDFSLDIDATELDIDIQDETEEPVVAESDVVTDVDDIDFGLNEAEDNTTAESDDEEISLDLSEEVAALDLDEAYETETDEAEAPEEIPDEISLDLTDEDVIETVDDSEGQKDADAVADIADVAAVSTDDDDFDLSSLDDVDEISTKLDLARAYLDMGDHEGTREILEEVLTDGNDEQKQEANELMAKLD